MAQITTTNRQAILELISQADETTEVAGLSASVTQLQIEVAGLSASVAGMTGGGGIPGLDSFISVDAISGVATFSASQSITNIVVNGLQTSQIAVKDLEIYSVIDDGIGNVSGISQYNNAVYFNTTDGTNVSEVASYPNEATLTANDATNQTSLSVKVSEVVSTTTDGTNVATQSMISTSITSTVTNGSNLITSLLDANNAILNMTAVDGAGNTSSVGISKTAINLTSTDGNGSSILDLTAGSSVFQQLDSSNNFSGFTFQSTDATIQSGNGTNTGTIFVESSGNITTTSTDGTNTSTETITTTDITLNATDGTESAFMNINKDITSIQQNTNTISSQLTLDPLFNGGSNGTCLITYDQLGTQSIIKCNAADITSISTDGTGATSSIVVQPASIVSMVTNGTNVSIIELDPAGLVNGNRLYTEDGAGSSTTLGFNSTGTADFSGTDGVTTGSIAFGPVSANMMANDQPNNSVYRVEVKSDDAEVKIEASYNVSQLSNIIAKTQSLLIQSTNAVDTSSISIQPTFISLTGLQSFDDDADAGTGGLAAGSIYQTTGSGASPLNVAGILMIKQ